MSSMATTLRSPTLSNVELFSLVAEHYQRELQACRNALIERLTDAPHAQHLTAYFQRGKMIRPLLVFLAAEAAGAPASEVIPAAEAVELLHVAALIHDDIMDCAEERRGLPSLHCRIGLPAAIVVGDYLILQAFETLERTSKHEEAVKTLAAIGHLARYAQECCKGQIQELLPPAEDCTEQDYFSVVRGKTASQFAAAVSMGAVFGTSNPERFAHIRSFGINAGIVFQIRDDELDLIGDSVAMGKPTGNSMETGRPLLPFIYLRKHSSPEVLEHFQRLCQGGYPRDEVVNLLREEGILARVDKVKKQFLAHALAELDHLHAGAEREALRAIGIYAANRSS